MVQCGSTGRHFLRVSVMAGIEVGNRFIGRDLVPK